MSDELRARVAALLKKNGLTPGSVPTRASNIREVDAGPPYQIGTEVGDQHGRWTGNGRLSPSAPRVRSEKRCGACGRRRLSNDRYCLACGRFTPNEGERGAGPVGEDARRRKPLPVVKEIKP